MKRSRRVEDDFLVAWRHALEIHDEDHDPSLRDPGVIGKGRRGGSGGGGGGGGLVRLRAVEARERNRPRLSIHLDDEVAGAEVADGRTGFVEDRHVQPQQFHAGSKRRL